MTSGQPTEAQLGEIRNLGVGHNVNLGLHDHQSGLKDEQAAVKALGMVYHIIPMDFAAPNEGDFIRF